MIEVRQTEVFANWFKNLKDRKAKARVQVRIDRMEVVNCGGDKSSQSSDIIKAKAITNQLED